MIAQLSSPPYNILQLPLEPWVSTALFPDVLCKEQAVLPTDQKGLKKTSRHDFPSIISQL